MRTCCGGSPQGLDTNLGLMRRDRPRLKVQHVDVTLGVFMVSTRGLCLLCCFVSASLLSSAPGNSTQRVYDLQQSSIYCAGMCTIEGITGTISATGTTPHTDTAACSHLCQAISQALHAAGNRHDSTGTLGGPVLFLGSRF